MLWTDVRKAYPDQWLVIEALEAHTTDDSRRHLDRLAVLDTCNDGQAAMNSYRRLHRDYPHRELYFVHTSRKEVEIEERKCLGIRGVRPLVLDLDRFRNMIRNRNMESC